MQPSLPTNHWQEFFCRSDIIKEIEQIYQRLNSMIDIVYPKEDDIFKCFKMTDLPLVKVVILGQDPYFNENQATGLSFSVNDGCQIPPSLSNIKKEIHNSTKRHSIIRNGDLTEWATQGVLLLNSILTVSHKKPLSHKDIGWQSITDKVLEHLNNQHNPIVFMLWGKFAESKAKLITNKKHLVLKCAHPSPLSYKRGFYNCNHFLLANEFLRKNSISPIIW